MRFSVLPQPIQSFDDSEHELRFPSSQSKNVICRFFWNNLIYFLSFIIPAAILLYASLIHQAPPFGDSSIFIGSISDDKALSVLLNFVNSVKDHSFSFAKNAGSSGMLFSEAFPLYLGSPLSLMLALFPQSMTLYMLSVINLIRISLSGLFMALYLTNRSSRFAYSKFDLSLLFFSISYATSSFMLINQLQYMYIDIFMLFPILLLSYEKMISTGNSTNFCIIYTFLLFDNCILSFSLFPLLLADYLILRKKELTPKPFRLLCLIKCILTSFCLSSVFLFPGITSYIRYYIKQSTWPLPGLAYNPLALLSRFFSFSDISQGMIDVQDINFGVGVFLFMLFILSISGKHISFTSQISRKTFILVLLLICNLPFLQYISNGFYNNPSEFNQFGFLVIFYIILEAADFFHSLRHSIKTVFSLSLVFPYFILIISSYAYYLFYPESMMNAFVFLLIYTVLIVLYRISSIQSRVFYTIAIFVFLAEMLLSTKYSVAQLCDASDNLTDKTESIISMTQYNDNPFGEYNIEWPNGTPLSSEVLPQATILPFKYSKPEAADFEYETVNRIFKSLGSNCNVMTRIFPEANITVPEYVICQKSDSGVYSIWSTSNTDSDNTFLMKVSITPPTSDEVYLFSSRVFHVRKSQNSNKANAFIAIAVSNANSTVLPFVFTSMNESAYSTVKSALQESAITTRKNAAFSVTYDINVQNESTFITPLSSIAPINAYDNGQPVSLFSGPASRACIYLDAGNHLITCNCDLTVGIIGLITTLIAIIFIFVIHFQHHNERLFHLGYIYTAFRDKSDAIIISVSEKINANRIPLLSVIIPFLLLLIICMYTGVYPFGSNLFFQDDGFSLTVPSIFNYKNILESGSRDYSWVSGGSNMFVWCCLPIIYEYLALIPGEHLLSFFTILMIMRISMCGFSLYYYMTHRCSSFKLSKKDYRILPFTTAYAISSYLISFRQFNCWSEMVFALPFLLLAMDQLIIKNKKRYYIVILALCMLLNIMNSLYICYFLCMWFFSYSYDSIIDFLKKGLRFAFSSILSAGMIFIVLFVNIFSRAGGGYLDVDNIKPDPFRFYQSYFATFRQLFSLPEYILISDKNGNINLYFGIVFIPLIIISIIVQKKSKQLITRYIILFVLIFSSNNDLMSYIWNGFHYQTMVPNRYSFITIFLLIVTASEGLFVLKKASKKTILLSYLACSLFIVIVYIFDRDDFSNLALILSLLSISFSYFLLFQYRFKSCMDRRIWFGLFIILSISDIFANDTYSMYKDQFPYMIYNNNYTAGKQLKDIYLDSNDAFRSTIISGSPYNTNWFHSIPSLNQFNSYVTKSQIKYSRSLGLHASPNSIIDSLTTPFARSIANTKYIAASGSSPSMLNDFDHYKLIGQRSYYAYLDNPYTLSMGFYIPQTLPEKLSSTRKMINLANTMSAEFNVTAPIYDELTEIEFVSYDDYVAGDTPETNYAVSNTEFKSSTIVFTPREDGSYYYQTNGSNYLGFLKGNKRYTFIVPMLDMSSGFMFRYNEDAFLSFYNNASKHKLDDIRMSGNTLDGVFSAPDNGYLMMSIPYDDGWKAFVDNNQCKVESLGNNAIIIKCSKGSHSLHMEFHAPGKELSYIITLIFWIIYFIIVFVELTPKKTLATTEGNEHEE